MKDSNSSLSYALLADIMQYMCVGPVVWVGRVLREGEAGETLALGVTLTWLLCRELQPCRATQVVQQVRFAAVFCF